MRKIILCLLLSLILMSAKSQSGSNLKLLDSWSYNVDMANNTIRITGGKIANKNTEGKSGTIKMIIYLTTSKYDSKTNQDGYILAEYKFKPLEAEHHYENIDKTLLLSNKPSDGDYYASIMILEYTNDDFEIKDYLNFNGYMAVKNYSSNSANNALLYYYLQKNGNNNNYSNGNQLKKRSCSSCDGTGYVAGSVAAYGSSQEKWCNNCRGWVSATHCCRCKVCPSCGGKGYTESY